jgi:hypothetical protein
MVAEVTDSLTSKKGDLRLTKKDGKYKVKDEDDEEFDE